MKVFVYGSLLPGLENHGVIGSYVVGSFPGRVRGRLVNLGPYPALLPEGDGTVRGLWMEVEPQAIRALDRLEEFTGIEDLNEYERIWVRDADHPERQGWVYIWTESRSYPFVPGDYWPDELERLRAEAE